MIKQTLISTTLASILLVGCGGGSDTVSTTTSARTTGYFVDAAVYNADYDCLTDGDYNKTTAIDGAFSCQNMSQVRFRIGDLILGEINALPADGYVFPQDIIGVDRQNTSDTQVIEMARLLQSFDSDANAENGIVIDDTLKLSLYQAGEFDATYVDSYLQTANVAHIATHTEAQTHLHQTMQSLTTVPQTNATLVTSDTTLSELTPELEESIIYMANEEKLAYDVYTNLYNYHISDANQLNALTNVASNSEAQHMSIMSDFTAKYGLQNDTTLPSGEFGLPEVQALYDTLYSRGLTSPQAALESACMVEVTDINDLNADLVLATAANATDVIAVLELLRSGSYTHYWAFDSGLKNMGIADGCCSLGTIDGVNYCHPEYPQNTQGGQGNGGPKH